MKLTRTQLRNILKEYNILSEAPGDTIKKYFLDSLSKMPQEFVDIVMSHKKEMEEEIKSNIESSPIEALKTLTNSIPNFSTILVKSYEGELRAPENQGEWLFGAMEDPKDATKMTAVLIFVLNHENDILRISINFIDVINKLPNNVSPLDFKVELLKSSGEKFKDHKYIPDFIEEPLSNIYSSSKPLAAFLSSFTPAFQKSVIKAATAAGKVVQNFYKKNPDVILGIIAFDKIVDSFDTSKLGVASQATWIAFDAWTKSNSYNKYKQARKQVEDTVEKVLESVIKNKFGPQIDEMLLNFEIK